MSERMMTVAEARETLNILNGRLSLTHASRAARTITAQAEQIERLQRAMRKTIEYNYESVEDLMAAHILLPGDMEAPE